MKAAKKAGRPAADGVVATEVTADGSFGVMLEVNSRRPTSWPVQDNFLGFVAA